MAPEAWGAPPTLAQLWVSAEPLQSPRGATLHPCPLLLLLLLLLVPAARHCQSEAARSTAADSPANGPSFRNRYRRCRCSAAQALFPCNSLTYMPAWSSARLLFPPVMQTNSSLLRRAHPCQCYVAKGLTFLRASLVGPAASGCLCAGKGACWLPKPLHPIAR